MTFEQIKDALTRLPPEQREFWTRAGEELWDQGFLSGAAKLPRAGNPLSKRPEQGKRKR